MLTPDTDTQYTDVLISNLSFLHILNISSKNSSPGQSQATGVAVETTL